MVRSHGGALVFCNKNFIKWCVLLSKQLSTIIPRTNGRVIKKIVILDSDQPTAIMTLLLDTEYFLFLTMTFWLSKSYYYQIEGNRADSQDSKGLRATEVMDDISVKHFSWDNKYPWEEQYTILPPGNNGTKIA